jgi:release factor glutamine methyltransferase
LTIRDLIKHGAEELSAYGIELPQLESEILLSYSLGISKEVLFLDPDLMVEEKYFLSLIERRIKAEPIAYIIGKKEFYGRDFLVDSNVLIPRPDTELIVEHVINLVDKYGDKEELNILDMGTGSGAIGITLALEIKKSNILAIDICKRALKVAENNAIKLGAHNISFFKSNLFNDIDFCGAHIIVANLPYVPFSSKSEISKDVLGFEPKEALFANEEGIALYRDFFNQIRTKSIDFDYIFIEIYHNQAEAIYKIVSANFQNVRFEVFQNLSGYDRVIQISKL